MTDPATGQAASGTEAVVSAIRRLVLFTADHPAAYRELFGPVAAQLGDLVETRLTRWLAAAGAAGEPAVIVLTGNAGTGKTAATEAFCRAAGGELPETDELTDIGAALVAKDVSGMATRERREEAFREVLQSRKERLALLCANEGVLRDAAEDLAVESPELGEALDEALGCGVSSRAGLIVVNLNRQRVTGPELWEGLLDFITNESLWRGCEGCPGDQASMGCPMRSNARELRDPRVRAVLRLLVQIASGDSVPTIRELLAVLAYAICGDSSGDAGEAGMWTCREVRDRAFDRGERAFTASSAYFNLVFGDGLPVEVRERSTLLTALERLGAGRVADLEVDDWLRDSGRAEPGVRELAGTPADASSADDDWLSGSRSPLDRVRTSAGEMTFHRLGELVSISEDQDKVRAGLEALVLAEPSAQAMWRRRVLFGASAMGAPSSAAARLIVLRHAADLVALSYRVANADDVVTEVKEIVKGLNFLVTGFADASEGLVIPEPASLFARNPGSFRMARPAFVHAKISADRIRLAVPDGPDVQAILDTDHVEVRLEVDRMHALTIGPRMYQAIREAEAYRGPVGQGTAEMTDLRGFYGRLAAATPREPGMQVADPRREALVRVQLPHFPSHD